MATNQTHSNAARVRLTEARIIADQGASAMVADSDPSILKILEPNDPNHLLRGWLLHAHKGRDRHNLAARQCDQQRYWLGIPATIISAIVGTATFAALQAPSGQASSGPLIQLIVGVLAVLAAILTGLQSFLDLGARAERHRLAGAKYKAVIRHMEQLGIGTTSLQSLDAPVITELRTILDNLEEEMLVVPPNVYKAIEARYRNKVFVDTVDGPPN